AAPRARITLPDLGEVLPAIGAEITAHVGTGDVVVHLVRSGDPVLPAPDRVIGDDRHVLRQSLGADVPLHQAVRGEVLVGEHADRFGPQDSGQLGLVDLTIALDEDRHGVPTGVVEHALQHVRGGPTQEVSRVLDAWTAGRDGRRSRRPSSGTPAPAAGRTWAGARPGTSIRPGRGSREGRDTT